MGDERNMKRFFGKISLLIAFTLVLGCIASANTAAAQSSGKTEDDGSTSENGEDE